MYCCMSTSRHLLTINPPLIVLHRKSLEGGSSQFCPRNRFRTVIPPGGSPANFPPESISHRNSPGAGSGQIARAKANAAEKFWGPGKGRWCRAIPGAGRMVQTNSGVGAKGAKPFGGGFGATPRSRGGGGGNRVYY